MCSGNAERTVRMVARGVLGNSLPRTAAGGIPGERTETSRYGVWRLPLVATACAVAGLGLLSAGLPVVVSPEPALHEGWQGHALGTPVPGEPPPIVARPVSQGLSNTPRAWWQQGWAPGDSLGNSSDDRIAALGVAPAPKPASRSSAGDEPIPGPAVPVEERDLRADLLSMSAAQHTGRWTVALFPMCLTHDVCIGTESVLSQTVKR
jgi:hypothetical protein